VSSHLSRNGFRVAPSQRYDVVVISWDVWAAEEGDAADARDGTCPPSSETCPAPDQPRGPRQMPPSLPNARNTRPASGLQYEQQHNMLLDQQRKQMQKQDREQEQQEKDRQMLSTKSGSKFRSIAEFKPNGRFVLRM
jgi:hypothetical protein